MFAELRWSNDRLEYDEQAPPDRQRVTKSVLRDLRRGQSVSSPAKSVDVTRTALGESAHYPVGSLIRQRL